MQLLYEPNGMFRWKFDMSDLSIPDLGKSIERTLAKPDSEVPMEHKKELIGHISTIAGIEITSPEDLEKFLKQLEDGDNTKADVDVEVEKINEGGKVESEFPSIKGGMDTSKSPLKRGDDEKKKPPFNKRKDDEEEDEVETEV